jgi:hypothetical protein
MDNLAARKPLWNACKAFVIQRLASRADGSWFQVPLPATKYSVDAVAAAAMCAEN